MTEITIKLVTGGICEQMRNLGWRFIEVTGSGRIVFQRGDDRRLFKDWIEVCKFRKEQEQADIEEVIADMREEQK